MNFKVLKYKEKEVIINVDRVICADFNPDNGQTLITCTNQFSVIVDTPEIELKKIFGIKNAGEGVTGFRSE